MAMLLVVATTEATDPTRVSGPFRTTADVTKTSSMRPRGETRLVAEEVGAEKIVHDVSQRIQARQTMEPRVRITSEGGRE